MMSTSVQVASGRAFGVHWYHQGRAGFGVHHQAKRTNSGRDVKRTGHEGKRMKAEAKSQNAGRGRSGQGLRTRWQFDLPPVEGLCGEDGHGAGEGLVVEARGGGVDFGLPFG